MAAGSTYTPIATTTLGSAAASYTFTSIPSTYTDLVLVYNGTISATSSLSLQVNSDTATNYSWTQLSASGSVADSGRQSNVSLINTAYFGTEQANQIMHFQNYANTSVYKTILVRNNGASSYLGARVGLWRSTSAITSIKLYLDSAGTYQTGSTFTLYGIAAA